MIKSIFRMLLSGIIVLILSRTGVSSEANPQSQLLTVSISASSKKLSSRLPVHINCRIKNNSSEVLTINPGSYGPTSEYIRVFDRWMGEVDFYLTSKGHLSDNTLGVPKKSRQTSFGDEEAVNVSVPYMGRDTYVVLEPGGEVVLTGRLGLKEGEVSVHSRSDRPPLSILKGYYIYFLDEVALVAKGDQYFLRCEYVGIRYDEQEGEKLGFPNVWVGKIVTEPIPLLIEP